MTKWMGAVWALPKRPTGRFSRLVYAVRYLNTACIWRELRTLRPHYDWVYRQEAPNPRTNETKPPHRQNDQIQHQARMGKTNTKHEGPKNTKCEGPKPPPNAHQHCGRTKPPPHGMTKPTPNANQRQGQRNHHERGTAKGDTKDQSTTNPRHQARAGCTL